MLTVKRNNEKFRSFKSKENIHKKEVGSYPVPSYVIISVIWRTQALNIQNILTFLSIFVASEMECRLAHRNS